MDRQWRIVYINRTAEEMLNRPHDTLLEKNIWQEFPESVENRFYKAYQEAIAKQQTIILEDYSATLKRWLQVAIYPAPDGLSIHFHDITRERQSEKNANESETKYRQLLDRITDGFIALDKNFYYSYVNKKAGELVQRDPAQMIGKNVWEIFPEAIDSYTYRAFQTAMQEQRFISNIDYFAPLDLWQENYIYPSPEGLSVFIKDITEHKKLERELLQAEREQQQELTYRVIEMQERERTRLGQELHDNINQIVTATKLTLSLLRDNPLRMPDILPKCISNLEMIIQENRKLSHSMVTPDLEKETLDAQLRFLVASMFGDHNIKASIHTEALDESRLRKLQKLTIYRIAQEQCTNIIKYSRAKEVSLRLETNNNIFTIVIADNGRGADLSKAKTGIGIRNMENRLKLFGGFLDIKTSLGEGFILSVYVPLTE